MHLKREFPGIQLTVGVIEHKRMPKLHNVNRSFPSRYTLVTAAIVVILTLVGCGPKNLATSVEEESSKTNGPSPTIRPHLTTTADRINATPTTQTELGTPITNSPDNYVPMPDLTENPQSHAGALVCTIGYYVHGFETSAIAMAYQADGNYVRLEPPVIWIAGLPAETLEELVQLPGDVRFGKIMVCGQFSYGAGYGHLREYRYQIVVEEVTILELSPPS